MSQNYIKLTDLAYGYGTKILRQAVNLTITTGDFLALIGPNGIGKTSLLNIILELKRPLQGTLVKNHALIEHYAPEHFPPTKLTARVYLKSIASIRAVSTTQPNNYAALVDSLAFQSLLDIPADKLSKGSLQKLNLIQALGGHPDVLLLDEPLEGLDEKAQLFLLDWLTAYNQAGNTIIMSVHGQRLANRAKTIYDVAHNTLMTTTNTNQATYLVSFKVTPDAALAKIFKLFTYEKAATKVILTCTAKDLITVLLLLEQNDFELLTITKQ